MMNIQLTAQATGLVAPAFSLRLAHSVTDLGVLGTAVS